MASAWSTALKNKALDGTDVDTLSLHAGDPGASGTSNELSGGGYTRQSCTWSAATGGEKYLAADVTFTGTALATVAYIGMWNSTSYRGAIERTSGDAALSAGGSYKVTTQTKLTLT